MGRKKWVESPPVPWVESSPFRNWVEWTWVDLEKCQVQRRQHIDFGLFDLSQFDLSYSTKRVDLILFELFHSTYFIQPISCNPATGMTKISMKNSKCAMSNQKKKDGRPSRNKKSMKEKRKYTESEQETEHV